MAHPTPQTTGHAIYSGAPAVGLRNVGSYQISGEPWITGSDAQAHTTEKLFKLPSVAREVSVYHDASSAGGICRVHFVSGSVHTVVPNQFSASLVAYKSGRDVFKGLHYVDVPVASTVTFKAKCKEVYVTNASTATAITYRVLADLTGIQVTSMYSLTGSGHTAVVGTEN